MNKLKPSYYKSKSGQDIYNIAFDFNLNGFQMNALKYIIRAGKKENESQITDLSKAIETLTRYKDLLLKKKYREMGLLSDDDKLINEENKKE